MAKDYSDLSGIKFDFGEKAQTCYDRGYKQGKIDGNEEGYSRGLEDAWKVARRLVLVPNDGGLDEKDVIEIFEDHTFDVLKMFSASEVKQKIKEWEQKQADGEKQTDDEIKVGDEVNAPGFHAPVVVIALYDDSVKVMNSFGDTGVHPKCNITKTGRHFDQISEVLKQIQEDETKCS